MAIKYHPDKNKDPGAEEMFKKIVHAHDILSNAEKRQIYDQFGEEGLRAGMDDDMDPMASFFRRAHQREKVAQFRYEISLEDYFTKHTVKISIPRSIRCEDCGATGFGDRHRHPCPGCKGTGLMVQTIRQGFMVQQIQRPCTACKGMKIDTSNSSIRCPKCEYGTVNIKEEVEVEVPADILTQAVTVVPNKGPWFENKYIDLAVVFKLKLGKNYGITSDRKLVCTVHINLTEMLCGFRKEIKHPSGMDFILAAKEGHVVNPHDLYMLNALGLRGDIMYVSFIIHYTESIKMPKKKMLNFQSLEEALGPRRSPDSKMQSDRIYYLDKIKKINNNPRARDEEQEQEQGENLDSDDEELRPGMEQEFSGPGCQTQ